MGDRPLRVLIDDVGRERAWPNGGFAAEFGAAPDVDFVDYAVRNLGYVLVLPQARAIHVRMRPALVAPPTIAALVSYISMRRPARVAMSWLGAEWRDEVHAGDDRALDRLLEIFATSAADGPLAPFSATRRTLGAVLAVPGHPFAPILHRWLDRACPENAIELLKAHGLSERALIVERDAASDTFVFRHSGRGIRVQGDAWANGAGRRVEEHPDRAYAQWIADTYRAVDDVQVARHELVHAVIGNGRGGRTRWRYDRLVLPWRRPDGGRYLMTLSTNVATSGCDALRPST